MTQPTGNNDPKVVATINEAIELAARDRVPLAVQKLTDLAQEFPMAAAVHGYLGWFLSQSGRQEEAIQHSRRAVELSPNSENASLSYFHVLWKAGQRIEALDEMRRFLSLRPSEEYSRILEELEPRPASTDEDSKRGRRDGASL